MGSPALLAAQATRVLAFVDAAIEYQNNHVVGGVVSDGGTTQGSGANTAPNLDLDVTQIIDCKVDGTAIEKAAAADIDSDAGDAIDFGATSGKEVVCAVVLEQDGTYTIVPGAVADTGEGVAPTDAEIDAASEPSTTKWVRLADVTFERTGDTTITVAVDHTVRPAVVKFERLDLSESDFADTGAARVFPITTDPPPA